MESSRQNAIAVGVLLLSCTAATLLSYAFSGPFLDDPDYPASLAATFVTAYKQSFGEFSVHELLNVPIALNELVLAVWLIVKGFNLSSTKNHETSPA